jgi:tRNA threonylcarbamoyladenosine biosynthesis protein TsaB
VTGPLILAIDTSSELASLALVRDGELLEEALLHSPDGFAHLLFGEIDRLLKRHGLAVNDIDCFGAGSGPGSFTGIRVALSAAKGLAEACGKPVAAVSNLQALAWHGTTDQRAPLLDARRGEIYGALYDGALRVVMPETVARFTDWVALLPAGVEFACLNPSAFPLPDGRVTVAPRGLAHAIAAIAQQRLAVGEAMDPAEVDANYVRRSDAELHWREA